MPEDSGDATQMNQSTNNSTRTRRSPRVTQAKQSDNIVNTVDAISKGASTTSTPSVDKSQILENSKRAEGVIISAIGLSKTQSKMSITLEPLAEKSSDEQSDNVTNSTSKTSFATSTPSVDKSQIFENSKRDEVNTPAIGPTKTHSKMDTTLEPISEKSSDNVPNSSSKTSFTTSTSDKSMDNVELSQPILITPSLDSAELFYSRPLYNFVRPARRPSIHDFAESHHHNIELDVTAVSKPETRKKTSISSFPFGWKRERTDDASDIEIHIDEDEVALSPPKRTCSNTYGFLSAVCSPINMLRSHFSPMSIHSSGRQLLHELTIDSMDMTHIENVPRVPEDDLIDDKDDDSEDEATEVDVPRRSKCTIM